MQLDGARENKYFASQEYLLKSRQDKLNDLWTEIMRDTSSWFFPGLEETAKVFLEDMSHMFLDVGDAMHQWEWPLSGHRQKYTH